MSASWSLPLIFVEMLYYLSYYIICTYLRFIDRGEFGEVYQGNAVDILGPETGPTPVAVKVIHNFS